MQTEATSKNETVSAEERYQLVGMLARGGQGDVWRARDNVTGQEVALKLLNDGAAHSPEFVERLRRERAALQALEGTCAVRVVDGPPQYNGAPCLAMEFLLGIDLESRLSELEVSGTRLSFPEVSQVLEPLVQTLHRAHGLGIVHRDLKPANVFLLRDGGVRLIDFGFARLEFESRMTAFGVVMGSPCYIAPEVWSGHANTSGVSVDIYSLAAVAFRMLGGRPPFETRSLVEMRELATRAERPSLHQLRPELSEALDEWVQRALAIHPADRYPSVRATWEALCEAVHQPKPSNWSIIPRAVAASFHPKRVAEALRRAGAVLWGRSPSSPAVKAAQPSSARLDASLRAPKAPRFQRPVGPPVKRPAAPVEAEPWSEAFPISVVPMSAAPRSSKRKQVPRIHASMSANIHQRNKRRKKNKRKRVSKQIRKVRQQRQRARSKRGR